MTSAVTFVPITMASSMIMIAVIASAIAFSMMLVVAGNVDAVVPAVLHKIDRPITSVIIAAVMGPFFCLARRQAQI